MRSRLVLILAIALAVAAVASAGVRLIGSSSSSSRPPTAHASLPPEPAAYLGVFETGAPPGYGAIAGFTQAEQVGEREASHAGQGADRQKIAAGDPIKMGGIVLPGSGDHRP